jgi:hypothetical protein
MSKATELGAEMAFNAQVHAGELQQLDDMIATLSVGTSAYEEALKLRHNLDVQFQLQRAEMLAKQGADETGSADKANAVWTHAFDQIATTAESSIASVITHRMTYLQMEQRIAQQVIQLALQAAAHQIANQLAVVIASQTGAAAQIAAQQAVGESGLSTAILSAIKAIAAYAATTFGGIFAFLSPTMGPAAAAPAGAGYAAVLAMQAQASAASGTSFVPEDMLANIHRGEIIIPKYDSDLIRGGGAGGHTFNYSPQISGGGADLARQVQANHEDFKGYINNLTRNGQLALPGRAQRRT